MFDYLKDSSLEINLKNNKLYIINYLSVNSFSREKIVLKHEKGLLDIIGKELVISKLLSDEILISGEITSIEFR